MFRNGTNPIVVIGMMWRLYGTGKVFFFVFETVLWQATE